MAKECTWCGRQCPDDEEGSIVTDEYGDDEWICDDCMERGA